MHQLWIARMCYVSTLCLRSWSPQTARGATWLSPQADSSVMCRTCQSLLTLSILQGEKWSEEVTPDLYCSLWPNDHMFLFSLGLLPYQGLSSARFEPCHERLSALAFPAISGRGEHSLSFRNAQHLSEMTSTFQYLSWDKRHRNRLMLCIWPRLCFWRTWGSSLCWTISLLLLWLKWVVFYFCTLM